MIFQARSWTCSGLARLSWLLHPPCTVFWQQRCWPLSRKVISRHRVLFIQSPIRQNDTNEQETTLHQILATPKLLCSPRRFGSCLLYRPSNICGQIASMTSLYRRDNILILLIFFFQAHTRCDIDACHWRLLRDRTNHRGRNLRERQAFELVDSISDPAQPPQTQGDYEL